jgi:ornithine carbamoyltransferase
MRHLVTLSDVSAAEIARIFSITTDLKSKHAAGRREALLPGRVMALLFEKPSLRARRPASASAKALQTLPAC